MSTSVNRTEAGSSREDRKEDNENNALMGDGDGYTGEQLEAMVKSGVEKVSTEQFTWFETFYQYLLPDLEDVKDEAQEKARNLKKKECIRNDLNRYEKDIGTPPSNLPSSEVDDVDEKGNKYTRVQTPEEVEYNWCVDRLIMIKRKALCKYAFDDYTQRYCNQMEEKHNLGQGKRLEKWMKRKDLLLDPENPSNLEDILDDIEQEEDLLENLVRSTEMTDEDWSRKKWEQMRKNRAQEQDENKVRQQQLEAGANVAAPDGNFSVLDKTIVSLKEDVPEPVRQIHKMMCIVMFHWWDSVQSTKDMANFTTCSERLDRLPDAAMYRVAPTEISYYMERLKKILLKCKSGALQEDLVTLAGVTITLTNRLRKSGLDLNMVLGRDPLRQIFRHLFNEDSEALLPLREQLRLAYLKPRKEHSAIYSTIETILVALIGLDKVTFRTEGLEICLEQIKKVNERIGDQNKAHGVQFTNHQIPTNDLEAAIHLYKAGQMNETKYQIAKFAHKLALLGVPDSATFQSFSALLDCHVDRTEILHEVLGISAGGDRQYTSMVQNVLALVRSPHSSEYAGVPMETVAWGKIRNSHFYINQYGPQDATIYRRERHQSDEWGREYGNVAGPPEYEVTSKLNRPGEWRETDMSTLKYGKRHVLGLYGVAYAVPRNMEDPLEPLDPDKCSSSDSRRNDVYVLVGWDFELTQKDPVLKWETRTRLIDLWKEDADPSIYEAAAESQERFEAWKRGELDSRDTSLQPLAHSTTDGFRYTSPGAKVPESRPSASHNRPSRLDSSDEDKVAARALGSKYRTSAGPQTAVAEGAGFKSRIRPSIEPTNRRKPGSERVYPRHRSNANHDDDSDESMAESYIESAPKNRWRQRTTRSPSSEGEDPLYRNSKRQVHGGGTRGQKSRHELPQEIRREYDRLVSRFGRDWMKRMDCE